MSKKAYHLHKGKLTKPQNSIPIGATNIITDNVTSPDGNVENNSPLNATYARRWVDENHL